MMTEEQRIEWLLELQEHPEQLTDEQLQQILADDEMRQLVEQLGFTKRAIKQSQLTNDTPDVDNEWEQFAASHAEELDALDRSAGLGDACQSEHETSAKPLMIKRLFSQSKIAASFIGVLLASGIAFATIQIVRNIKTSKPQTVKTEQAAAVSPAASLPTDTIMADTIPSEPCVFNNVPLDSMLTTIAAAHGVQVKFENDAVRELRFHFVWKRKDSLSRVVEKLNTFEAVNIAKEDKKLVVR
ncbi:MAG: DUF4974 domain-containing protein [Bacteroidaceae bacterium]|nr:DUF4974 domain-containing protein [Bacteroidaceae bacterium]